MDLEQRVSLLEQEVKLLKTEVQCTLLDIQEQLLSTRFSALRAQADGQPDLADKPVATIVETAADTPVRSPILKVFALGTDAPVVPGALDGNSGGADEAQPGPETLVIGSLQPVPSQDGQAAEAIVLPAAPLAPTGADRPDIQFGLESDATAAAKVPLDWETMRRQTDWTIQTVRKFGPQRTQQLIEVYARSGFLSATTAAVLQRVAAAFQPEPQPARKIKFFAAKVSEPAEVAGALDTAHKRDIIRRIISRLQRSAARQDAYNG